MPTEHHAGYAKIIAQAQAEHYGGLTAGSPGILEHGLRRDIGGSLRSVTGCHGIRGRGPRLNLGLHVWCILQDVNLVQVYPRPAPTIMVTGIHQTFRFLQAPLSSLSGQPSQKPCASVDLFAIRVNHDRALMTETSGARTTIHSQEMRMRGSAGFCNSYPRENVLVTSVGFTCATPPVGVSWCA